MSDDEDYVSEEDADYVPSEGEQVSEEENSGDEEDLSLLKDDDTEGNSSALNKRQRGKKTRKKKAIEARKRRGGIKLDEKDDVKASGDGADSKEKEESEEEAKRRQELAEQIAREEEERKKEKEKKRADDLWSSFMADVKKPVRPCAPSGPGLGSLASQVKSSEGSSKPASVTTSENGGSGKAGKVTITKVFDFAGEEIKITKEVDADSKEAKAEQKKLEKEKASQEKEEGSAMPSSSPSIGLGIKRPAVGGLGSVLNKISKKNKMGTLDKSKLDWESFKKKEGIEEDLKIHNKGKHGYTERMAFLNRADQRQYEIERDIRLGTSSKR